MYEICAKLVAKIGVFRFRENFRENFLRDFCENFHKIGFFVFAKISAKFFCEDLPIFA
jgi:hypothetical protein